jgi:hypothetical protein
MATLAPPPAPPLRRPGDDDRLKRYRLRMTQASATLVTLLATAWLCTLGAIPAILALCVAKHILVAILAMGLGIDRPDPSEV